LRLNQDEKLAHVFDASPSLRHVSGGDLAASQIAHQIDAVCPVGMMQPYSSACIPYLSTARNAAIVFNSKLSWADLLDGTSGWSSPGSVLGPHPIYYPGTIDTWFTFSGYSSIPEGSRAGMLASWYREALDRASAGHAWSNYINSIDWAIFTREMARVAVPRINARVATLQAAMQRAQAALNECQNSLAVRSQSAATTKANFMGVNMPGANRKMY